MVEEGLDSQDDVVGVDPIVDDVKRRCEGLLGEFLPLRYFGPVPTDVQEELRRELPVIAQKICNILDGDIPTSELRRKVFAALFLATADGSTIASDFPLALGAYDNFFRKLPSSVSGDYRLGLSIDSVRGPGRFAGRYLRSQKEKDHPSLDSADLKVDASEATPEMIFLANLFREAMYKVDGFKPAQPLVYEAFINASLGLVDEVGIDYILKLAAHKKMRVSRGSVQRALMTVVKLHGNGGEFDIRKCKDARGCKATYKPFLNGSCHDQSPEMRLSDGEFHILNEDVEAFLSFSVQNQNVNGLNMKRFSALRAFLGLLIEKAETGEKVSRIEVATYFEANNLEMPPSSTWSYWCEHFKLEYNENCRVQFVSENGWYGFVVDEKGEAWKHIPNTRMREVRKREAVAVEEKKAASLALMRSRAEAHRIANPDRCFLDQGTIDSLINYFNGETPRSTIGNIRGFFLGWLSVYISQSSTKFSAELENGNVALFSSRFLDYLKELIEAKNPRDAVLNSLWGALSDGEYCNLFDSHIRRCCRNYLL